MNKKTKNSDDILNGYIKPELIEKAPDGFTARVMRSVQFEPIPLKNTRNLVPVISGMVTILLILTAFLIPGNDSGTPLIPAVNLLKHIKGTMPSFSLNSIFNFSFPALVVYIFIGILILTLFDRALNIFFHQRDGQV